MDKDSAIKMLAGTLARGILWAAAALAAKMGTDAMSQSTAEGIAYFAAGLIVAAVSAYWSSKKDARLLESDPPK